MTRLPSVLLSTLMMYTVSGSAEADERQDLIRVLRAQVRSCYTLPSAAIDDEPVLVEVRLMPDGSLEHEPQVLNGPSDSRTAKAALRALSRCAPFKIPTNWVSRYQHWNVMRIQFNTTFE